VCVGRLLASERGHALVETAVAMPLLLAVVLGLLQFALYAHAAHVVTAAAQSGARMAAAEGQPLDAAVEHAQAVLRAGLGRDADGVAVQVDDGVDVVIVEVRGQLPLSVPWVAEASLPLSSRAVMSREWFRAGPTR
jgi:Flp pilus assembly protein TadG